MRAAISSLPDNIQQQEREYVLLSLLTGAAAVVAGGELLGLVGLLVLRVRAETEVAVGVRRRATLQLPANTA